MRRLGQCTALLGLTGALIVGGTGFTVASASTGLGSGPAPTSTTKPPTTTTTHSQSTPDCVDEYGYSAPCPTTTSTTSSQKTGGTTPAGRTGGTTPASPDGVAACRAKANKARFKGKTYRLKAKQEQVVLDELAQLETKVAKPAVATKLFKAVKKGKKVAVKVTRTCTDATGTVRESQWFSAEWGTPTPEDPGNKIWIFAKSYNVLRIMSGMGGLAYSN